MTRLFKETQREWLPMLEKVAFPVAALLVPAQKRSDWAQEWRAELWQWKHRRRLTRPRQSNALEALSLAYGLTADAAWLRVDWVRASARGSAGGCLSLLSLYCFLCGLVELMLAGSWSNFVRVLTAHFFGSYVFVAGPALFIAMVTYPLRPIRCESQHLGQQRLSARNRWNLFLVAKITLTLLIGFLSCQIAIEPVRMAIGKYSDWAELLLPALVVTVSLRWALLNQEQRCQKCLRMLSQPTRVGPPSHNFLHWSGMELVCADGHGLLHVPEMRGSWCWYDRWVERDQIGLSLQA